MDFFVESSRASEKDMETTIAELMNDVDVAKTSALLRCARPQRGKVFQSRMWMCHPLLCSDIVQT